MEKVKKRCYLSSFLKKQRFEGPLITLPKILTLGSVKYLLGIVFAQARIVPDSFLTVTKRGGYRIGKEQKKSYRQRNIRTSKVIKRQR